MDQILANMATSESMDKLSTRIEGKLKKLEKKQDDFGKAQKDMLTRIEVLEKESKRAHTKSNKVEQRVKRLTEEGIAKSSKTSVESDSKAYELARKQLIRSPVSPDKVMVRIFLERQMEMDPEAVRSLDIVSMKKIFQKPGQKAKNGCQTIVTFSSIYERDLVMGHASNLPQDCACLLYTSDAADE